jgi:hypothetical protein
MCFSCPKHLVKMDIPFGQCGHLCQVGFYEKLWFLVVSNHFQSMTHDTLQMEKIKKLPLFTLLKNCIYGDCINLQLHVLIDYVTTRLQHWKMISCTWVLGKFQGYGGFWTYFGQLYNVDQCALTLCFNCFIVVICNLSTQMRWCGLQSPSPYKHIQCGKFQLAWTLPCHMHGLCDNLMCNCLATLVGLHCN